MKKINVLVIDDDDIINEIVKLVLSKPFAKDDLAWYNIKDEVSCQVYTAKDAIEASLVMAQHVPDVILLDVEMPYMNGFQFLRSLRDDDDTTALPVVMLTASADRNAVYKAAKLGAVGYVKKPFLPKDLIKRVLKAAAPIIPKASHVLSTPVPPAETAPASPANTTNIEDIDLTDLEAILADLESQASAYESAQAKERSSF